MRERARDFRKGVRVTLSGIMAMSFALTGCAQFAGSHLPSGDAPRTGTVESVREAVEHRVTVKFDDGTWRTVRQVPGTGLKVGERVRVTGDVIEPTR